MKFSERVNLLGLMVALALGTAACERNSKEIEAPKKPGPASGAKPPATGSGRPPSQAGDPSDTQSGGGGSGSTTPGGVGSNGSSGGSGTPGSTNPGGVTPGNTNPGGTIPIGTIPGTVPGQNGSTNVNIQTIVDDGTGQTIQWDGRTNQGNERWDVIPVN